MLSTPLLSRSKDIARDATDATLPRDINLPRTAERHAVPIRLALRLVLFVCCSMALLLGSVRAAHANAIIVTDAGDTPSVDCTLREAIINANNDDQSGSANCAIGSGDDTITFHADLAGSTIILTSGPLTLTSNIDIFGGSVITVSANNASRIFDTTGGSATLSGLTLRDGNAVDGGAVRTVNGTLSIIDTTVISNAASGYGGGIFLQTSTAEINNTQFISNSAGTSGGGVAVMTMTLQLDSTDFMSNTAAGSLLSDGGGGLWSNDAITQTGGIYQGNSSGNNGGGLLAFGGYTLTDVNFVGNRAAREGGGTHQFSNVGPRPSSVTGGTFQKNSANGGNGGAIMAHADPLVISGTLILSNTATGSGGGVFNYADTHIINSRLQNNNNRAVYSQQALKIIGSQFVRSTGGSGAGAFSNNGGVDISHSTFAQTVSSGTGGVLFVGSSGDAIITNTVFLSNTSTSGPGGAIFVNGGSLTVSDSRFENNKDTGHGGAIYNNNPTILVNTDFISNTSLSNGGAIFAPVTVTGGLFERNSAASGGAIWAQGSSAVITGATFISNTARAGGGGAVWGNQYSTAMIITNTAFISNVAHSIGGGAVWANGLSILDGVTFANNRFVAANAGGGGMWANNATDIRNSTFMSNTSAGWSGGLFLQNTFTVSNTTFIANDAARVGGGLTRGGGSGSTGAGLIVNSLFARNTANGNGEAIALETGGPVQIVFTTVGNEVPRTGAAIFISYTTQAYITNTIISGYDVGISQGGSSTVSEDYNLFFGNGTNMTGTVSSGGHSQIGDPAFANPAADDYHLTVPSAAIGVGVDQGIYTDYFGDVRPQLSGADTGFDIGFDEYLYTYDVALVKSVSPTTVQPGDPLTYTIHFSNTESGLAGGIVISDTLPNGVTVTGITSSTIGSGIFITQTSGGPLPSTDSTLAWEVNKLDVGESGVLTITGVVTTSQAVAGTFVTNIATITASNDLTDTNNVGTASVQVKPYLTIGGAVSGLAGSGLVLQNNGSDDLTISDNGVFTFTTPQLEGETYSVTVQTQPAGPLQVCTVSNGTDTVATANITDVDVTCSTVTYTLALAEVGDGTVTADPSLTDYPDSTIVTLTATPATGWAFSDWSVDVITTTNPVTLTMDGDKNVTATFTQNSYALTVNVVGSGSVGKSPNAATYAHGTQVTLTPTPATGYSFVGWSGACTGSGACVVTMDAAKSVTATFTGPTVSIEVEQTVGTDPATCADSVDVTVFAETTIYYCYTVENTGSVTLTSHTLEQSALGEIFTNLAYDLAPGETTDTVQLGQVVSQTVTVSSSTVATWTAAVDAVGQAAFAINEDAAAVASAVSTITVADADLTVEITVGTVANGCATTESIVVPTGSQVYFCVTLINTGAVTLTDITLRLTTGDVAFPSATLAPGGTIQFTSADTALLGPISVDRPISMGVTVEALGAGTILGRFTAQSQAESTATQQPTALDPDKQPEQVEQQRFLLPWLTK